MTDHEWDECIYVKAALGRKGDVRFFDVVAPSPLAVAITGNIHALARLHPPGTRLVVGRKWVKMIEESAVQISEHVD